MAELSPEQPPPTITTSYSCISLNFLAIPLTIFSNSSASNAKASNSVLSAPAIINASLTASLIPLLVIEHPDTFGTNIVFFSILFFLIINISYIYFFFICNSNSK